MISVIQQSLSVFHLSNTQNQASSHNMANISTGFSQQRARGVEARTGGVRTQVGTVELSASERQIADRLPGAQNNVSLVNETVAQIAAVRSFQANASVVRGQDRLVQSLLDVTG